MGLFDKFRKPGEGEEKSDQIGFCLTPDPGQQDELRELRLLGIGTLTPRWGADGELVFLYKDQPAGEIPEPVRAWIRDNRGLIDLSGAYSSVVGGGHQVSGDPRPFTWFVRLKLKKEAIHPKDALLIGAAAWIEDFPSDCVCCISKTKKVHVYPPTCGASAIGLPRAILDEIDMEKYSVCQKCFRSFW